MGRIAIYASRPDGVFRWFPPLFYILRVHREYSAICYLQTKILAPCAPYSFIRHCAPRGGLPSRFLGTVCPVEERLFTCARRETVFRDGPFDPALPENRIIYMIRRGFTSRF